VIHLPQCFQGFPPRHSLFSPRNENSDFCNPAHTHQGAALLAADTVRGLALVAQAPTARAKASRPRASALTHNPNSLFTFSFVLTLLQPSHTIQIPNLRLLPFFNFPSYVFPSYAKGPPKASFTERVEYTSTCRIKVPPLWSSLIFWTPCFATDQTKIPRDHGRRNREGWPLDDLPKPTPSRFSNQWRPAAISPTPLGPAGIPYRRLGAPLLDKTVRTFASDDFCKL